MLLTGQSKRTYNPIWPDCLVVYKMQASATILPTEPTPWLVGLASLVANPLDRGCGGKMSQLTAQGNITRSAV